MTTPRRLGRPLPCHFALGRNRKLQGLAAAILKLQEKCEIAKTTVKKGVQNTNNDLMAEELKCSYKEVRLNEPDMGDKQK
ncbi:putative YhbY-like superfamily protein [Helianthus anomalus]